MRLRRQILTLFLTTLPIFTAGQSFASLDAQAPAAEHHRPAESLIARQPNAVPASSESELVIRKTPDREPSAEALSQKTDPAQGLTDLQAQELLLPDALAVAPVADPEQSDPVPPRTLSPLGISYESDANAVRAIDRNIYLFSERMKQRFSMWLERSAKYVDIMKGILREKSVPEELVFLPIVESGFNPNAYSHARAVGPWQFIEGTAKRYGLVVDWWRDERKDPMRSTHAAASYLRDLHKMFGSWNLALAAYNAGEGRISKALRRSESDTYWELLHTQQIRPETKEYVPRYIAATMIAQEPAKFGFHNLEYHEPMSYEEVTLHGPVDLDIIARCAETDVKEIRELNPELRRWSTPPNMLSYTLRIPAESRDIFIQNFEKIPVKERFSCDLHTVRKKENLKTIANKLHVPVGMLVALNNMNGLENLKPGDTIKVPPRDKFQTDLDDRMTAKKGAKVAAKKKGKKGPKTTKTGKKGKPKTKKSKTKKV